MTNSIEHIKILNPNVYNNINQIPHQEKLFFKGESRISNVQPITGKAYMMRMMILTRKKFYYQTL